MINYENGPGNIPRLPDRVVDTLIDSAGVSRCAPGEGIFVKDQTSQVERLVHDSCEELLARLPYPYPSSEKSLAVADLLKLNRYDFGTHWGSPNITVQQSGEYIKLSDVLALLEIKNPTN